MESDSSVYADIQALAASNNAAFWIPDRRNPNPVCRPMNVFIAFLAFHALNVALGVASWFTVVFGVVFSVVLLPLCLCGIQVFQLVAFTIEMLAYLDIALANTIPRQLPLLPTSQTADDIQLELRSGVSRPKMVHVAYFLMLKPFLSLLSFVILALSVVLPIQLLMGVDVTAIHHITTQIARSDLHVVTAVSIWLLSVASISVGATASWRVTRHFCIGSVNLRVAKLVGDFPRDFSH